MLGDERGLVALDRLEVGGATTGGIKVSGFFLKRGMFGGGMMVVHLISVQPNSLVVSRP